MIEWETIIVIRSYVFALTRPLAWAEQQVAPRRNKCFALTFRNLSP